jgi:hypothetical protein
VVVSHSTKLIKELRRSPQAGAVELIKDFGETRMAGVGPLDGPTWDWGGR